MTKKFFVVLGFTGLCLITCCLPGKQYDVLNLVADTTTIGDNAIQQVEYEIELAAKDIAFINKKLKNIELRQNSNDFKMVSTERPEYDPLEYVNKKELDLSKIDTSTWEKIDEKSIEKYIRKEMVSKNIYTQKELAESHDIVNLKYSIRDVSESTPFIDVYDSDEFVEANAFPKEVKEKLIKTKVGESFTIECEHPSRKTKCEYIIQINEIKGLDINDEVVTKISRNRFKTVKSYKENVKQILEQNSIERIARKTLDNSLAGIINVTSYPEDVIKYEIEKESIKYQEKNNSELTEKVVQDISDKAVKNLKAEIRVLALLKKYDLWLDEEALDDEIDRRSFNKKNEDLSQFNAQYIVGRERLVKEILEYGGK